MNPRASLGDFPREGHGGQGVTPGRIVGLANNMARQCSAVLSGCRGEETTPP